MSAKENNPEADKKIIENQYENNYLFEVLFRMDFMPLLKISAGEPAEFQEYIRKLFPEFKKNNLIDIITKITKDKKIVEQSIIPEWFFSSTSEKKIVKLNQEYLILVFTEYTNFEDYFETLKVVYDSFQKQYSDVNIKRIGLRYRNKIKLDEGNPLKWDGFINPFLTSIIESDFINKNEISKSLGQLCLNKDDYNIIFNYGIPNGEYPATISRKEFILDYDCSTKNCENIDIIEYLNLFNIEITKLFERCIGDKLRRKMKIK